MSNLRTCAHLSDLHIGHSSAWLKKAVALRDALRTEPFDDMIVTGDVTEHGKKEEFERFQEIFGEFLSAGRMFILPGNHDRLGSDALAHAMMRGRRVDVILRPGLSLIRVDTTGSHNRFALAGHGKIDEGMLEEVRSLIAQAPVDALVVVGLHHHLLPLPTELWLERFVTWLGLPTANELRLGRVLIDQLRQSRCDLILHGHRHTPKETIFRDQGHALHMYNGGSSTALGRFRVFTHQAGKLVGTPRWVWPHHKNAL